MTITINNNYKLYYINKFFIYYKDNYIILFTLFLYITHLL